jgi:hypothetical protein
LSVLVDGEALPGIPAPPVPAGGAREAAADLSLEAGYHGIEFRMARDDSFLLDNHAYLALRSHESVPVLVVEPETAGPPWEAAGYYLRAALDPDPAEAGGLQVDVRRPWALPEVALSDYAVVFLCDMPDPSGAAGALRRYVEDGGGVVMFLGERTQRDAWNRSLLDAAGGVLAASLGTARDLDESGLAALDLRSPFLQPFQGWESLFGMVRVRRAWGVEAAGATRVVARFGSSEGPPAILTSRTGQGWAVLLATGPSDAWHDWPRSETGRITWVALLNRMAEAMAAEHERVPSMEPGRPLELPLDLSRYQPSATLRPPARAEGDASPRRLRARPLQGRDGLWLVSEPLRRPGLWSLELRLRDEGLERVWLAVNVPPEEGRLERVERRAVEQVAASPQSLRVVEWEEFGQVDLRAGGRAYWRALAWALLALLLAETVAAHLFANPRRDRSPQEGRSR